MDGGISCGAREVTDVGGLLVDLLWQAPARRRGVALVERPAACRDAGSAQLQEDMRLACERVKAEVDQFGPALAQTGLLAMLEVRLPDTHAHAQRVARSSVALARAMGLPESDVRDIRCAALLHDIGKIAIPSRLLGHCGRLDDEETAALRLHVTIGADLLGGIPTLAGVATMVAATHERYDGSGYPGRVAGNDIPLGARIIAVGDSYDAMVAGRPYREPVTREEAHHEMVRCSGSHFDPAVVREWIALTGTLGFPAMPSRPAGRGPTVKTRGVVLSGRFDRSAIRPPA